MINNDKRGDDLMRRGKTDDEIVEEMDKKIKKAVTEEDREKDRKEDLVETLWDDVQLMADISEMLNRISMYFREYETKRMNALKEDTDEL